MCKNKLTGGTFSILGDSYSTFQGCIPSENSCYYPQPENVDDVLRAEDTWWYLWMQSNGMRLLCNESYSGATVCTHVRDTQPPASSFVVRAKHLADCTDETGKGPDYIFLFGGTNDDWLNRERGQLQFENWTEEDLRKVLPAYCYVLDTLCNQHPGACLVCVINSGLDPRLAEGLQKAGNHYGAAIVPLKDISKQHGHPTALGMKSIADQIDAVLKN